MITKKSWTERYELLRKMTPLWYKILHAGHEIHYHQDGYKVFYCCSNCRSGFIRNGDFYNFYFPVSDNELTEEDAIWESYKQVRGNDQ